MIRFFFEFLQPISWWWGALVLVFAGVTALVNVFYALLSPDLKRALAYHSVENIGIILAGLGLALLFGSESYANSPAVRGVAGLALIACLYHVINHALFKGLLYLGTGSIEKLTGTYQMDELGGLLRRFPWTGTAFLVGAVAIAGFPPFNGFISEWLTVQSAFAGIGAYSGSLAPVVMGVLLLILTLLAVSFAMTALAFVKIAGETLLGLPRHRDRVVDANQNTGDVSWLMRSILLLLATLCLVLGLAPVLLAPWIAEAAEGIGYDAPFLEISLSGLTVRVAETGKNPLYVARLQILLLSTFFLLICLPAIAMRIWARRQSSPVWAGGEPYQPRRMQYTGIALSSLVWGALARSSSKPSDEGPLPERLDVAKVSHPNSQYIPEFFNRAYNWLIQTLLKTSTWVGEYFQNGDIRSYLLYIFVAFILVLLLLVIIR